MPTDADIVCARAKNHYAPKSLQFDDSYGDTPKQQTLEDFKAHFKPPHSQAAIRMYFVSQLHFLAPAGFELCFKV